MITIMLFNKINNLYYICRSNTGCPRKMLVAGSVGPYGACQHDGSEYTGKYVDNMTIQVLVKERKCFFDI